MGDSESLFDGTEPLQRVYMDFSGNYTKKDGVVIDCSKIPGTNGYCDEAAENRLRSLIADFSYRGIHFLDSGNYHYLTLLWMEKIREDYSLLLFDNHPDCKPPAFNLLSCGGWVATALESQSNLRHIYMMGVAPKLIDELAGEDMLPEKVTVLETPEYEKLLDLPVYVSIDLDVLRTEDAACDWDQGRMSIAELTDALRRLELCEIPILGADICGEKKSPTDREKAINESTVRSILESLPKMG